MINGKNATVCRGNITILNSYKMGVYLHTYKKLGFSNIFYDNDTGTNR